MLSSCVLVLVLANLASCSLELVSIAPGPPDAEEDERGSPRRKSGWPGRVWAWGLRALHFELPPDGPSGNHQLSESCVQHLDGSSPNPSLENGLDFNPV